MNDLYDYSATVYRVLLDPKLMLGIGTGPTMFILVITATLMSYVSIFCVVVGVFLYVIAKFIVRKDPYMLTILMDRLLQPDEWRI